MNRLRRAPLKRLVVACAGVVLLGAGAAIAADGIDGPTPPPASLADAIHGALTAAPVPGVSAHVTFTDNLVTGAALQSSSPLITGASGRVWISSDGRARLELQSGDGDTEIVWDGTTLSYLDAASGTVYRYTPQRHADSADGATGPSGATGTTGTTSPSPDRAAPSVADIQTFLAHLATHADVSGATPDDVAGQPAYSVRISPLSGQGGLIGGVALWWDAVHGVPLRIAIYAAGQSDPVLELTADDVSYGPIDASVFATPTAAKTIVLGSPAMHSGAPPAGTTQPAQGTTSVQTDIQFPDPPATLAGMNRDRVRVLTRRGAEVITYGQGLGGLVVLEREAPSSSAAPPTSAPSTGPGDGGDGGGDGSGFSLPTVTIDGAQGTELSTALGTIVSFQRDGLQYVVAGSVTAATALDAARGL